MTLRLPSPEAVWIDLERGVRILHRPATPAEFAAASAWASRRADQAEADLRERLGVEPDAAARQDAWAGYLCAGLARLCVTGWEGVEGDFSPAGAEALMAVHGMAAAYLPAAIALVSAVQAEGNGSAPAPTGTTAGAPNTAGGAGPAA